MKNHDGLIFYKKNGKLIPLATKLIKKFPKMCNAKKIFFL